MTDQLITETKQQCQTLRWLQNATCKKGNRPILSGINKNGELAAADGFQLHIHHPYTDNDYGLEDGVNKVRDGKIIHKTPGRVYEREQIEGTFPNYKSIMPHRLPWSGVLVNKDKLMSALESMPTNDVGAVTLSVYGPRSPMKIESEDDNGYNTAVLMPMHSDNNGFAGEKRLKSIEEKKKRERKAIEALTYIKEFHPEVYKKAIS